MNICIIYFSQTGNTAKVAETMKKVFSLRGANVVVCRLKDVRAGAPLKIDDIFFDADLIGFGTPCFSCQIPRPVRDFIEGAERISGKKVFVFSTAGGAPGIVLEDLKKRIELKGAEVVGGLMVRGEIHHPGPSLNGRFPGRPDENDLEVVRDFASAAVDYAFSGFSGKPVQTLTDAFLNRSRFYGFVAKNSADSAIRRLMPEPVVDTGLCDNCGLCAADCPMENITIETGPVIGDDCIRCYRCMNICPQNVFSAKWDRTDIILKALYNPFFERKFSGISADEKFY